MGPAPAGGSLLDFHVHAFPDDLATAALARLSATSGLTPAAGGSLADLLACMDRDGVGVAVVHAVATHPRQAAPILRWAREIRSPRVVPFPSVHPASDSVLGELEDIAREGFAGIKLHPQYQGFAPDEERMDPIYRECARLGLAVLFHMGHDASFPPSDVASPARLLSVRRRHPRLVLVAAHLGGWRQWEEAAASLLGEDIYLDTAFTRFHLPDDLARTILLGHRPDRILFGSDFPWDTPAEAAARIRAYRLPGELERACLRGNGRRLLGSILRTG
jgi:hypothetical protein